MGNSVPTAEAPEFIISQTERRLSVVIAASAFP
jgi:hypothetical protein